MYKIYSTIIIIVFFASCKPKPVDPFDGVDLYGKDLASTLNTYHQVKHEKAGAPAMYIDFSAGMFTAFGSPGIKDLMAQSFNTVLAQQFDVFKLAQAQVMPLQIANSTELGQIVNDKEQYRDVRAPIQAAVEKIVASKNDALLITDFEEWQNNSEVTSTAYLKIPFSSWLKSGNSITFFVTDYLEGKVQKHVYFTVFTYGKSQGNSLIDKLRPQLAQLPKFDLATDAYQLTTNYPGAETGGIFRDLSAKTPGEQNVLDLQTNYIKQGTFEYYPLGVDWKSVEEARVGNPDFKELFRKLYVDLSNTDSYQFNELEIKVFDATADFERYAKSLEVNRHRPHLAKGNDGESKFSDKETDIIALTCFTPDGQIRSSYQYEETESPEIPELFVLNNSLFSNTLKTDRSKAEIGVAFAPQFVIAKIPEPSGLMKIELKVKELSVNSSNPLLSKFKWINRNGVTNEALYASITGTLQELKPTGQTLYTYYIKTTEQN